VDPPVKFIAIKDEAVDIIKNQLTLTIRGKAENDNEMVCNSTKTGINIKNPFKANALPGMYGNNKGVNHAPEI